MFLSFVVQEDIDGQLQFAGKRFAFEEFGEELADHVEHGLFEFIGVDRAAGERAVGNIFGNAVFVCF